MASTAHHKSERPVCFHTGLAFQVFGKTATSILSAISPREKGKRHDA